MKRLVPYPVLATFLLGMWILLTGFSPGHMLLGSVIAILVSRTELTLRPEQPTVRFSLAMVKLLLLVAADIVRSNIATARVILFSKPERKSGFIELPVTLRSPYALATLSIILTATPGTLWVQYDPQKGVILIHLLDIAEEQKWVANYHRYYERLLTEIFE